MKGKKNTLFVLALLLLVGISSGYIANTYAKYVSTVKSDGTAAVAKWNFTKDNKDTTFTVNLDETINSNTLVDGKIAPGTSGSFDVLVSNTSETGVHYTVKLKSTPEATIPTNLKFYADETHSTLLTNASIEGDLDAYTGTTTPSTTLKIYWNWEFESDPNKNSEDTAFGLAAAGVGENGEATDSALTIGLEITGEQRNPHEAAS